MTANGGYIHGFGEDEMRRLTRMQELLNGTELRVLDLSGAVRCSTSAPVWAR